ncbi:MAG: isoprenylcysteine carboxylmethyltransferase family protein, partial [Anaerolineae bacterium]|nr:isoprenylcysteine carboxylmethyltransferase family protein [Anaerolineae bacterium]
VEATMKGGLQVMKRRTTNVVCMALSLVSIGQIVAAIVFYNCLGLAWLANLGWGVMMISAVFGWLPIFTFRRQGGVAAGKGYIHTTRLVDSGIYGIVRHPQYLAGMLLSVALALIAPHWIVAVLGAAAIATYVWSAFAEDRDNLAKFGDAYRVYMNRVPRLNAAVGLARWLLNRCQRAR